MKGQGAGFPTADVSFLCDDEDVILTLGTGIPIEHELANKY